MYIYINKKYGTLCAALYLYPFDELLEGAQKGITSTHHHRKPCNAKVLYLHEYFRERLAWPGTVLFAFWGATPSQIQEEIGCGHPV